MRNHWTEIEKYLEDQKIAQELIGELRDFHMRYEVKDQIKESLQRVFTGSARRCIEMISERKRNKLINIDMGFQ